MRKWRKANPQYIERQREALKRFLAKNPNYHAERRARLKGTQKWKRQVLENVRKYRKRHPEKVAEQRRRYAQRHPDKKRARNLTRYIPLASECEKCGDTEKLERHHPDYSRPREFQTLCHDCHKRVTDIQRIEGIEA